MPPASATTRACSVDRSLVAGVDDGDLGDPIRSRDLFGYLVQLLDGAPGQEDTSSFAGEVLGHFAPDRAPHPRRRDARGQFDRSIEVVGLEQEVAAERFLGLDERTVGCQNLAPLHPHGGCRLGVLQLDTGTDAGGLADRRVLARDRLLLVREALPLLRDRGVGAAP